MHHRESYELARQLARLRRREGTLAALGEAIRAGLDDHLDYAAAARRDPDLRVFAQDPDFLALTDPLPRDPVLRPVYQALDQQRADEALRLGNEALRQPQADVLAILQAMEAAAQLGVALLRTRGIVAPAPDQPAEHYQALTRMLRARIQRERAAGRSSDVFRRFEGR